MASKPMPELPRLTRTWHKLPAGLLAAALCALFYAAPAALTAQRAVALPLFDWERAIPYLPGSAWAYVAQYPLLLLAYFGTPDLARCTRFLVAAVLVQAMAALVFLAWPVRYPRESLAAPAGDGGWTRALVDALHRIDAPVNCLPSLHVTSCLLCLWLVGRDRRWLTALVAVVSGATVASTLTFKQHYAVDLLAAVPVAAGGWWLAGRLSKA
jgi:hypothetical protein